MDILENILQQTAKGELTPEQALQKIRSQGIEHLGFAHIDQARQDRCGIPEVVFAQGKTVAQIMEIMEKIQQYHGYALATRVPLDTAEALKKKWTDCRHNIAARTILLGTLPEAKEENDNILVIAAGTSDIGVAEEAAESIVYAGCTVKKVYDIGVAGIHRIFAHQDDIDSADAIVVVAGMEGALASVIGGLVKVPVIAVPTSVGYGASFAGVAALLGMLNSCTAGVGVVNIDNGFGAGILASRIILNHRRK